jgi:hypothetical protein
LFASSTALAAEWRFLGRGSDDRMVSYDAASVRRNGPIVQVWLLTDFSNVKSVRARSQKDLWKFNCADQTTFTASSIAYAADGSVVASDTELEFAYKYQPVVPDSMGEIAMKAVCL